MAHNLKVGDRVLVTRVAKSHEKGWDNTWVSDMNRFVGKVGTVKTVSEFGRDSADIWVEDEQGDSWGFPAFVLQRVPTEMSILQIKRSLQKTGLKIYGTIMGEKGKTYRFAYIRRSGFRGWICNCDSFFLSLFKKNRHCKHIKFVTEQYGRYGQKVGR